MTQVAPLMAPETVQENYSSENHDNYRKYKKTYLQLIFDFAQLQLFNIMANKVSGLIGMFATSAVNCFCRHSNDFCLKNC